MTLAEDMKANLANLEQRIAEADLRVARQRALLQQLADKGTDTQAAAILLALYTETYQLLCIMRQQSLAELEWQRRLGGGE